MTVPPAAQGHRQGPGEVGPAGGTASPRPGGAAGWEAGQVTLTHFLSTAAEKQTLPWSRIPGPPLHTRSSRPCRDKHAHADRGPGGEQTQRAGGGARLPAESRPG